MARFLGLLFALAVLAIFGGAMFLSFPKDTEWGSASAAVLESLFPHLQAERFVGAGSSSRRIATELSGGGYDVLVVGAGLSGAVLAERHAKLLGHRVLVVEKRDHVAGNTYDYVDRETGILVNSYGVHLFHTNSDRVWDYVRHFAEWQKWEHRVLAEVDSKLVPVPVNIDTVNALFNKRFTTREEMDAWLAGVQTHYPHGPRNSEEMALSRVGPHLYDKIFKPYTTKQWNCTPASLNPSVTGRIPVRNNHDDRYFTDRHQFLPVKGYTELVRNMLKSSPKIKVLLGVEFTPGNIANFRGTTYYTGPIDRYFDGTHGPLQYRSLVFERRMVRNVPGTKFPASQVNFPSLKYPYTRVVEYKHLLKQKSNHTLLFYEYPSETGEPYYPVPSDANHLLYRRYQQMAQDEGKRRRVHFVGRLANYKYYNMDQAILNALEYFDSNSNGSGVRSGRANTERGKWPEPATAHNGSQKPAHSFAAASVAAAVPGPKAATVDALQSNVYASPESGADANFWRDIYKWVQEYQWGSLAPDSRCTPNLKIEELGNHRFLNFVEIAGNLRKDDKVVVPIRPQKILRFFGEHGLADDYEAMEASGSWYKKASHWIKKLPEDPKYGSVIKKFTPFGPVYQELDKGPNASFEQAAWGMSNFRHNPKTSAGILSEPPPGLVVMRNAYFSSSSSLVSDCNTGLWTGCYQKKSWKLQQGLQSADKCKGGPGRGAAWFGQVIVLSNAFDRFFYHSISEGFYRWALVDGLLQQYPEMKISRRASKWGDMWDRVWNLTTSRQVHVAEGCAEYLWSIEPNKCSGPDVGTLHIARGSVLRNIRLWSARNLTHDRVRNSPSTYILYIRRRGSREILNHDQVMQALESVAAPKYSVEIHGGGLPFIDQLTRFANAFAVVGTHGAGMSLIVGMRKGRVLVEATIPATPVLCFAAIAAKLELEYRTVVTDNGIFRGGYNMTQRDLADVAAKLKDAMTVSKLL